MPFKEIKENDWDLSINKYKEIEYEEIEYEAPEILIQHIINLENEIVHELQGLKEKLKG